MTEATRIKFNKIYKEQGKPCPYPSSPGYDEVPAKEPAKKSGK